MKYVDVSFNEPVREPGKTSRKKYFTTADTGVAGGSIDSIELVGGVVRLVKGDRATCSPAANAIDFDELPATKK